MNCLNEYMIFFFLIKIIIWFIELFLHFIARLIFINKDARNIRFNIDSFNILTFLNLLLAAANYDFSVM